MIGSLNNDEVSLCRGGSRGIHLAEDGAILVGMDVGSGVAQTRVAACIDGDTC